jgi:O-antigen/teichoic acid export membrane protein
MSAWGAVRRNLAWLTGGEVALKGGLLLAGIVVARGGGPAAMGVFTIAFGAALVAAQVLAAGQPEVVIREVARRGPAAMDSLVVTARRVQRRAVRWAVPPLLVGAAVVAWRSAELGWALAAMAPYAALRARLVVLTAAFKGQDRMEVEIGARALELALALTLLAAAVVLGMPAWAPGAAFSLGAVAAVAMVSRLMRRSERAAASPGEEVLRREGLPFLGLAVATQLLIRADSLVQGSLGVPAADVGQYGVAHAAVWSLIAASQLLAVAVYPSVSRASGEGGLRSWHALALGVAGGVMGALLAAVLFALRRPLVQGVFGANYSEAVELVGVLAWLLPGASAAMLTGVVLAATRRQAWSLASQGALVAAVVAGNLWAVPRWGVAGSAAVAVLAHSAAGLVVVGLGAAAAACPRTMSGEEGW